MVGYGRRHVIDVGPKGLTSIVRQELSSFFLRRILLTKLMTAQTETFYSVEEVANTELLRQFSGLAVHKALNLSVLQRARLVHQLDPMGSNHDDGVALNVDLVQLDRHAIASDGL